MDTMLKNRKADPRQTMTLVSLLRHRAQEQGDQTAYTFLKEGEAETETMTYYQLEQKARIIAARLQSLGDLGNRALLMYPSGLEFIAAFFGCLYAGMIAVPANPPRLNKPLSRLKAILTDSGASLILTTTSLMERLERQPLRNTEIFSLQWIATATIHDDLEEDWHAP